MAGSAVPLVLLPSPKARSQVRASPSASLPVRVNLAVVPLTRTLRLPAGGWLAGPPVDELLELEAELDEEEGEGVALGDVEEDCDVEVVVEAPSPPLPEQPEKARARAVRTARLAIRRLRMTPPWLCTHICIARKLAYSAGPAGQFRRRPARPRRKGVAAVKR